MKFRQFKNKLRSEEYNIPDVLSKIKDRLPEVSLKHPVERKPKLLYRYAWGFASLIIMLLLGFSSITQSNPQNEISGPTELNYFHSSAEIDSTLKKYNKLRDTYISKSAKVFENYTMDDIEINKIYESNNQIAMAYKEKVFYLNDKGLVVFDTSNNDFVKVFQQNLSFDETTNVKTLYIVDNNLIIVYNNKQFIHIDKYDINTMQETFEYSIASTYVNSTIHNNKLFLVSILNDTVLPTIKVNDVRIKKVPSDIGYLENVIGDSYTILTSINIDTDEHKETIFLSFNKWDIVYFSHNNVYLINNHMNYKKNLEYGEYTTVVKFSNVPNEGLTYHGSYTIKGKVQDINNVYEYNNDLRMALEVTHYNVKKVFLFFNKVSEVEHSINVINLRSTTVDDNPILDLTSSYIIKETDDYDQTISILSTNFNQNKVVVESRGTDTNITVLDFTDPLNIKTASVYKNQTIYSNVIPLDNTYGFNIRTIKTGTGEFGIRFFYLSDNSPLEIPEQYQYLNYSYLINEADYVIIDAISKSNSLYLGSDEFNFYIGFSVRNNLDTGGAYTLIKIDKETKVAKFQDLSSNNVIVEKLVETDSGTLYGLNNNNIIRYSLNSYDNFVKNQTKKFN